MKLFLVLLLLSLSACTPKPKPQPIPPPPPIQRKPVVRKVTPKPGDTSMQKCTVTRIYSNGKVDCLCHDAAHKIDSTNGEYSMECKN
jgi:hypothetical protein